MYVDLFVRKSVLCKVGNMDQQEPKFNLLNNFQYSSPNIRFNKTRSVVLEIGYGSWVPNHYVPITLHDITIIEPNKIFSLVVTHDMNVLVKVPLKIFCCLADDVLNADFNILSTEN